MPATSLIKILFQRAAQGALAPALFIFAIACNATGPTRPARSIAPSLEQIFDMERPIDGTRPSDPGVSADGRYISYRHTGPAAAAATSPASQPSGRGARRANLYVCTASAGALENLGDRNAEWLGFGADMVFTENTALKLWHAGTPIETAATIYTFPERVGSLQLSPEGLRGLATAGERRYFIQFAGTTPRVTELAVHSGARIERISFLQNGLSVISRNKPAARDAEPGADSKPASQPATAPDSRASTRPAEPPASFTWIVYDAAGARTSESTFVEPGGVVFEGAVAAADGSRLFITFGERSRDRNSGIMPDYLTKKVTNVSVRGTSAADPWRRQMLHLLEAGGQETSVAGPFSTLERQRFEVEPVADPSRAGGVICIIARTQEDRRGRDIIAVRSGSDGLLQYNTVLQPPGPVGGIENITNIGGAPVVVSEGSGRARAHVLQRDGSLFACSPEDADVHWISGGTSARAHNWIALVSRPDSPWKRQFWRMFTNGEPHAPLPMPEMFVTTSALSKDGSRIVFLGSTLGTVDEIHTMPADGSGAPVRITRTAPTPEAVPGDSVPLRIVSFPSGDGTTVWSYYYEPPSGVRRNGACIIFLHGAGYLQQVRASTGFNNYAANHHFHRRLASMGFVVMAPDFRGSAGYGRKFRTDVYQNLGIPDSSDVVAAKQWAVREAGCDPARVGLYGGSYGGFLTLMCLLRHPTEFGAGAALRSVTDWAAYHAEYTRPLFGGGPDSAPEAYHRTSPVHFADRLERPLLLLHGMQDDNVFVQDTIRMVEELQKAKKTQWFELMIYPSQNHSFTATHAWLDEYRRIEEFFIRHLLEQHDARPGSDR